MQAPETAIAIASAFAIALMCHLPADYFFQSDWQARFKMKFKWITAYHALCYSIPFSWLMFWKFPGILAWIIIAVTHYFIDHYNVARWMMWAKNFNSPKRFKAQLPAGEYVDVDNRIAFKDTDAYGLRPGSTPDHLAVWVKIINDNWLHLFINTAAILLAWNWSW